MAWTRSQSPTGEGATVLLSYFLKTLILSFFGGRKVQKEHLEKTFGGSIPGGVLEKILLPIATNHISHILRYFNSMVISGLRINPDNQDIMTLFLQVSMSTF